MENAAFTTTLPYFQQILAKRTSVQDLLSASQTWIVEATVEGDSLQHCHPGVNLIGLIGYDTHRGEFVLLRTRHAEQDMRVSADSGLSTREQEVLRLVVAGCANKEIARRLTIAENTVKVHLRNIFDKLNVQSRTEAAMRAVRRGWISVPQMERTSPA